MVLFYGVCELSVTLDFLSTEGLPVVWHQVSSTETCRQFCGAGTLCQDGDHWENSHQLIFPGSGISLVVQHLGFSIPTIGTQAWSLAGKQRTCKLHGVAKNFLKIE